MAVTDPYELLGVKRDSSQKEVQSGYRRMAKKLHPDLNPGDKGAQAKFQDLNAAYDVLGDEVKRARFDRGEIDGSGAEQPQRQYYRDFADKGAGSQRYESASGFSDFDGTDDILSAFFSRGGNREFRRRGHDLRYRLEVDFLDAVNGATPRITLPDDTSLDVTIPPGTRDGQVLRLAGKGGRGPEGGEPGDALIEISVRPHAYFRRDGNDILLDLPISLREAVRGAKIAVPTPAGPVKAIIPKGANTGKVLRLKGKGVADRGGRRGDQFLTLQVMMPEPPDAELETFVSRWPGGDYNPRRRMGF